MLSNANFHVAELPARYQQNVVKLLDYMQLSTPPNTKIGILLMYASNNYREALSLICVHLMNLL